MSESNFQEEKSKIKSDNQKKLSKREKIAVLGLPGSGKTTYLTVLNRALVLDNSLWEIFPTGNTTQIMALHQKRLFKNGLYPDPTLDENVMEFSVEKEAGYWGFDPGAVFTLVAGDVPGEAIKGKASEQGLWLDFYEKHVKKCNALIFLIDPDEFWKNRLSEPSEGDEYFWLFSSIFAEIKEQSKNMMHVAFCITKLDVHLPPGGDFDKYGDFYEIEDLAEKILGKATKKLIDHTFSKHNYRWFPVSATGYTTDSKGSRRTQFTMRGEGHGVLNQGDITPIGVAESVEWILNEIAASREDYNNEQIYGKLYKKISKIFRRFR